ncbi:hypothetical protein [Mycobacterium vicinigordonae]|uniref:Uncharacterized protein n=1 Tax=Mycobacterium vicinigordonae TaxID=1719132 RepID=A0A7D6DXW4_9MYCO|nr:hypothetical protein [Mycobacterium vicinigordonae]QLL07527.1 hypothetical protein H0P51_00370 [Mycobacterium vicinigordonae]
MTWLPPAHAQLLAAATGVPAESFEAMTLSQYDGIALHIDLMRTLSISIQTSSVKGSALYA